MKKYSKMIKNTKLLSIGLLLCFITTLTGCPYGSKVPLSNNKLPIDSRLLGRWKVITIGGSSSESYMTITKLNDKDYILVIEGYDKEKSKWEKKQMVFFTTKIQDTNFWNVEYQGDDGKWINLPLKYTMKDNKFFLQYVSDKYFKRADDTIQFDSPPDLENFVKIMMSQDGFYEEEISSFQKVN